MILEEHLFFLFSQANAAKNDERIDVGVGRNFVST